MTRRLPRTGIGKIDRTAIERRREQRIDVESVTLHRIRLPFKTPFATARGALTHRDSLIVEVRDRQGRTGLGECVAFATDRYLPEILDDDERMLREVLAPAAVHEVYLHPSEAGASFATKRAAAFPLARGAIEPALWDLYGKIVGKPLWRLIGGAATRGGARCRRARRSGSAPRADRRGGAPLRPGGLQAREAQGAPGGSAAALAVHAAFPQLMITLDANQSFSEEDPRSCGFWTGAVPLGSRNPSTPARAHERATGYLARLARLQRGMNTPICLDESIVKPGDAARALRHPGLRCYALKIAKWAVCSRRWSSPRRR